MQQWGGGGELGEGGNALRLGLHASHSRLQICTSDWPLLLGRYVSRYCCSSWVDIAEQTTCTTPTSRPRSLHYGVRIRGVLHTTGCTCPSEVKISAFEMTSMLNRTRPHPTSSNPSIHTTRLMSDRRRLAQRFGYSDNPSWAMAISAIGATLLKRSTRLKTPPASWSSIPPLRGVRTAKPWSRR